MKKISLRGIFFLSLSLFILSGTGPRVDCSWGEGQTKILKCWRCHRSFPVPIEERTGKCPYCGAKFVLPPPSPAPSPSPVPGSEPAAISWRDGPRYKGQTKSVKGKIVGTHLSKHSGNLYLNFSPDYKSTLSIKIPKADLEKFPPNGADFYNGKTVIATGRIAREKKYLRLIVTDPADLKVLP